MTHGLLVAARELEAQIVADRRHIHAHPELRYEEFETSKYVQTRLGELGIDISPARIKCALLSLKALKVGAYGLSNYDPEEDEESA